MIGIDSIEATPPGPPPPLIAVLSTPANVQLVKEGILPLPYEDGVPLRILAPGEQVVFLSAGEWSL